MERLLIVAALTAVIHFVNTLIYAVRVAGVRTGRLATAYSLFNVVFLLASTANSFQGFLLASIVEQAIREGQLQAGGAVTAGELPLHPAYHRQLAHLDFQIRLVMAAATAGTVAGAVLIPSFVHIFVRAIVLFEEIGSVPRLLGMLLFSPRRAAALAGRLYLPKRKSFNLSAVNSLPIPRTFLVLNLLVTGIYTTGVLSSLYAGALFPDYRTTAASLSAVVNGIATVLAATVVDPTAAAITDQALRGERCEEDVKQVAFYLTVTRLAGTLLAQLFFVPAAHLVKMAASLLA